MARRLGFSLIEMLISVFLLSCVLIGVDAIELFSLRLERESNEWHIATLQMNEIAERLCALNLHDGLSSQIVIWNKHNDEALPGARGSVSGRFPFYTVIFTWGKAPSIHFLKEIIDVQKNKRPYINRTAPQSFAQPVVDHRLDHGVSRPMQSLYNSISANP